MPSVVSNPVLALPSTPEKPGSIKFLSDDASCNFVRVWLKNAPLGSKLRAKLDASGSARLEIYEGPPGTYSSIDIDKGGAYVFYIREYRRGSDSGYGGGYEGDPASFPTEKGLNNNNESVVYLPVADKLSQRLGAAGDFARLVLYAWDDEIQQTYVDVHGIATPRIELDGTASPRARTASEVPAVKAALTALVGVPAGTAVGDAATVFNQLLALHNSHITTTVSSTHATSDTTNGVPANGQAPSPSQLPRQVSLLLEAMRQHRRNAGASGATVAYHTAGPDLSISMPLYSSTGALEDSYGALADIARAHDAHVNNLTEHGVVTTSAPTLPKIMQVHKEFLVALASSIPPVQPETMSIGAVALIHGAGFTKVD